MVTSIRFDILLENHNFVLLIGFPLWVQDHVHILVNDCGYGV